MLKKLDVKLAICIWIISCHYFIQRENAIIVLVVFTEVFE